MVVVAVVVVVVVVVSGVVGCGGNSFGIKRLGLEYVWLFTKLTLFRLL